MWLDVAHDVALKHIRSFRRDRGTDITFLQLNNNKCITEEIIKLVFGL